MAHQWKRMICMVMSLCLTFGGTVWAEPLQTPSDGSAIETVSQQMPVVPGDATPEVTPEMTPEAIYEVIPDATPEAHLEATAATTPEVTPEATPDATAEPTPEASLDVTAEPTPEASSEATAEPTPEPTLEATAKPTPNPTLEATAEPTSEASPEATAEPTPDPTLEATAEPTPDTPPEQTAESTPEATAEATLHATPEATPEATPTATPEATVETKRTIVCFEPGTYTLTAAYGAALEELGLPAEVTALLSDGTTAQLAVVWTCVGDGLGGTAYIPEHENPLEAAYTFQAALADGSACPVALPTATVTYAMPQLMANGEVQTGMADSCPYKGFNGPLTWEMVEGEYLTIMVSSPNTLYLEREDNRFSGMELTINVENGGRLIVEEDISCPFVINNYGRVSVMAGATATVNNVGQYSQISSSGNLTLTGGTCNGRVACEAGHLEAQGITFSDQAPCLITRDTANLDGSTFYAYLEICEGATVDGDFSMRSSTCQLAGTVNGTIHINSSECMVYLKSVNATCTLRANHKFVLGTAEFASKPENVTIQLTPTAVREMIEDAYTAAWLRNSIVYHYAQTYPMPLSVQVQLEGFAPGAGGNSSIFGHNALRVVQATPAEGDTDRPAGEGITLLLTVELWGANADLYEFVGGVDQMEARLWVTVEKMPMTVTACSFEAEYNGSDNFQNVKLTDATLACAYDTDSPYLTDPIGAGLTANVDINPQRNDVLNVQWEDGKPAANEKLYAWFAKEYVSFTATAEDGNNYDIQPVFNETRLTYTILPKAVTVSGDIRFTTESRPGSAKDALGQSGLSFDGFIGGDSYGSIRGALTSMELLDAEGNDLTQAEPGVYQVASITSVGSNYCFKPDDLTVTVLKVGDGSVTMESWNEGETPAEPVAVSDTHTEQAAVITYAAQGTDVNNDSLWSDQKPTAPGAYTVRAVWPEQLGYDRLVRTANFSIVSNVDWSAVHWNYDPLDPTRTTITLEGLPDYLAQDAVYSNNTALYLDDTGKYRTATVEFPSYPNLTVPDEIKSIEWYCKKGYTYGTYTLRLKAVNCDVTFTPRTAQPGQTLSAGAKIYSNQEIYIDVTVPEGYTLVALALTNSSFTQVVNNRDESLKQDGARYKLTAPNDTKSYDLNVLAIALPEDGIGLSQGSSASLIYYAPSPDGKRPGYSETLDLTEYFDLAPEVQYWFTSSGSNNGKFSLNGSILSWTSGDVTSDGRDFQVKQGITWDKWSSQDSVAVGQQTISSNASLNVVQERVSQPDFNGTVSLPVESAQPGDTIAAVLENFTDYDRADVRWQWQRNPLGVWEDIPGATEMTYTVTEEDQDCQLRLCYNVGMGTDVHGMFTNEVTCGEAWTYSTTIFADRTTVEKDEQATLTVTVRRDDGTPGTGMVQWYMNGAALGEPVAMTAGAVQLKLRGEELELGQYTVYAIFQSKSGATLPTDEVTVTVSKIDLSDLLYTDTPIDTSVYYRGGTIPLWHTITVTYDQENWPQELSFPDCLTVTAYYNGAANQDKKKNYVTVSSDSIVYGANRPAQYVLKVEVNSDLYCGTLTTGTLTVKEAPLTVKPKDIYAMRGETITLGPEIIDDGITSFGLHGNDSWSVWIEYTVTDSQGEVVATGTSREPLSVELPVGEYTVSIDPQTPSTNQNQVYGNLYNKDNKLEPYVMQGIYDVTLLPGKLVITEEPYVNPTAVSRSGDYLDIDVENWNLDTCPYAGYDFDTSALPAGFSMDDLDFVVTYNGEVTTNLDLDCTKASLKNVAALKIDEEQGTVRLYPLWQGTYTITAQLKQGATGYQFNAQTATVHVGTVPSVISIYVEEPDKIYHPGDELVVIVDETGEARRYDGTPFWWTSDQTVTFTVGEQSIKGKYTLLNYPLRCVLTLPDDFQPGQYEITMDPGYYTYGMAPEGQYGYEPVTPVSFRVENLEYIVTIPASVTMDETGKASLPLSCSQLEGGSRLTVTVDSANDMKLQGETGTIAYTLTAQNGMAIFDGNTAATFTGTGETTLSLNVAEGQDLAPGHYTDTLTFTASAE